MSVIIEAAYRQGYYDGERDGSSDMQHSRADEAWFFRKSLFHTPGADNSAMREAVAKKLASFDPEIGNEGWDGLPEKPVLRQPQSWNKDHWRIKAALILGVLGDMS